MGSRAPLRDLGSRGIGEGWSLHLGEPGPRKCLAKRIESLPVPDRISFPKWQQWLKAEGKRPTKRKDGVGLYG